MEHDNDLLSQLAGMLIFVPIIADTLSTVVRRIWTGHHPFHRHVDFHFQRMILRGIPQKRIVGLYWLATLLYGILSYLIIFPFVFSL